MNNIIIQKKNISEIISQLNSVSNRIDNIRTYLYNTYPSADDGTFDSSKNGLCKRLNGIESLLDDLAKDIDFVSNRLLLSDNQKSEEIYKRFSKYHNVCYNRDAITFRNMKLSSKDKKVLNYLKKSFKRILLGEWSEENATALSIGVNLLLGIFDFDIYSDVEDLTYHVSHFDPKHPFISSGEIALDGIGLFPILGVLKYSDDIHDSVKAVKGVEKLNDAKIVAKDVDSIDDAVDTTKGVDKIGKTKKSVNKIDDANGMKRASKEIDESYESINWDIVSKKGETRLEHIGKHEINDLSKKEHGVFYSNAKESVEKAWKSRSKGIKYTEGDRDIYVIPYKNAGYSGGFEGNGENLDYITIITKKDTNKIITGFPGDGHK